MRRFSYLFFLLAPTLVKAQFTYVFDQSIPVSALDGTTLTIPWGGGLNATQYNTMDLDHDGKDDLVLYDRMAGKVVTLLNDNGTHRYAPEYEFFFPDAISNWLLLRDFNCDGRKDVFTGDVLGIKVYENVTAPGGNPAWKQFLFFSGFSGSKSPVLLSKGFSNKVNVQIQFDDLPAITDADGDGDLDIFNFRFVGTGTVEFHKNYSMERYGSCDSLDFERITQNWGNFKECGCSVIALNGSDCPPSGRTKHAGGKSLLAMDTDGDQDIDLVMSEAECTRLYELRNQGTLLDPVVNSFTSFPSSRPVNMNIYPTGYFEDVDFDGQKDLVVSPGIFTKTFLSSNLEQSNHLYKIAGSGGNPSFDFVRSDFLQGHMIDAGDNAVPAFADFDSDGDYDMFISRNSSQNFRSTILQYENTGTEEAPSFKLVNDDFLFFSFSAFHNLKIQFADIDSNNTIDLAFTATNINSGATNLFLLLNRSQTGFDFFGQSYVPVDFSLNYSENLYFTDVDADGKNDILAGRGNGLLEFWRNSGQVSQFQFTLEDGNFLQLGSSVFVQNISTAAADLDADGNTDLILGDQSGKIKIVSDFTNVTDASAVTSEVVFNPLLNYYAEQNLGGRIWPTAVNLFKTTKPAIVSGNVLGGLSILRHDNGESLPDNPVIEVFPNPVTVLQSLKLRVDRPAFVQLYSLLGQKLSEPVKLQAHQTYPYALPALAAGLYVLKFTIRDKSYTRRFVISE